MLSLLVLAAFVFAVGYFLSVLCVRQAEKGGEDGTVWRTEPDRGLSVEPHQPSRSPSRSLADVARVQRTLLRRLPRELVDAIFLKAEYFATVTFSAELQLVPGPNSKPCLLADFDGLSPRNIVGLAVAVRGRGDLQPGCCDPCRAPAACAQVRTWYSVATAVEEEHDLDAPRLFANPHCSSVPQVHEEAWTRDDAVVKSVQRSGTLVVWAHSSTRGWTNVVTETTVTVSLYPF